MQMPITREFVVDTIGKCLRQQERIMYLEAAVNYAGATIVADVNGTIQIFNPAAEEMFGIARDLVEDHDNIFHLLEGALASEDGRTDGLRIKDMLVKGKRIRNIRILLSTFDNRRVPALLTINYMLDQSRKQVGIVAQLTDNSEVERLTVIDHLTGLFNKAHFERLLTSEYARMERCQVPSLSLLFLDIDDFGQINKKLGHDVGDLVLKAVAKIIEASIRTADTACRFGGEEICVILPVTGFDDAKRAAARVCDNIRNMRVDLGDGRADVRVTASVGVSTHYSRTAPRSTAQNLLLEADAAMRFAKRSGKDRYAVSDGHAK